MLRGAMKELAIGDPALLSTDVGPVITQEAAERLEAHVAAMRARGFAVHRLEAPEAAHHGSFVAPTLIEIGAVEDLPGEVFGPVLHVLRYRRDGLDKLVDAINATGYGLTFGLHTRIDETIAAVTARIGAGNVYVNRNIVGAVVGVQPFGGNGLSGTGPKAGGPLYLGRLVQPLPGIGGAGIEAGAPDPAASDFARFLAGAGEEEAARRIEQVAARIAIGGEAVLAGPVGQRDSYRLKPRGRVLVEAQTPFGRAVAVGVALAAGNSIVLPRSAEAEAFLAALPASIAGRIVLLALDEPIRVDAVLHEGDADRLAALSQRVASIDGPIIAVHSVSSEGLASGREAFYADGLVEEVAVSVNTAAAGGNASLMSIG